MTDEVLPLVEHVTKHAHISKERAQELVQMGAVYLEKIRTTDDRLVKVGSYLRIHSKPRRYAVDQVDWKACIVKETPDFLVVNKPPGIPVPSTVDNLQENIAHQLSVTIGAPLYVTQRLDRPTSGLVLLAKTKPFQREFNHLLLNRQVEKKYVALTEKKVLPGLYSHFIEDSKSVPKRISPVAAASYVTAELRVLSCEKVSEPLVFESSIQLITGRTHQIRAQFSYLGYPLLGDTPYGGTEVDGFYENRIGLRAVQLKFLDFKFEVRKFSDEMGNS